MTEKEKKGINEKCLSSYPYGVDDNKEARARMHEASLKSLPTEEKEEKSK